MLAVGIAGCLEDTAEDEPNDSEDTTENEPTDGEDNGGSANGGPSGANDPETVVEQFYDAYLAADLDTLQGLIHPDRHDELIYDGAEADLADEVDGAELLELTTELLELGDDEATVRTHLLVEVDGENVEHAYDEVLRKHDGEWMWHSNSEPRKGDGDDEDEVNYDDIVAVTEDFWVAFTEPDVDTVERVTHPDAFEEFEDDWMDGAEDLTLLELDVYPLEKGEDEALVRVEMIVASVDRDFHLVYEVELRKHDGDWKYYSAER